MTINFELKADLAARGFIVTNENICRMEYAEGSIARYTKCAITLGHTVWGGMADDWFYMVRYESFAESGQPEVDHHTIWEGYVALSKLPEYLKSKGIYTKAERDARWAEIRRRVRG